MTSGEFTTALLENPPQGRHKSELPFIKLATFSGEKTKKNCCRHDRGVVSVTGCELDYDKGGLTIHEAADRLEEAGVRAYLYPTPSNTEENPRWRALLPFAAAFTGTTEEMRRYRKGAVAAAVEILGEDVANESYTLSQSYYYGQVDGKDWLFIETEGETLDQVYEIESYVGEDPKAKENGHDRSDDGLDIAEAIRCITTGEEVHTSTIRLAARYAALGMKRNDILEALRGVMNASEAAETDRWDKRMEELEAVVDSAVQKFGMGAPVAVFDSIEDAPDAVMPDLIRTRQFEFPEGLVGEVAQYVMDSSPVPNKPFAIMAGLLTVSVLSKNRFKVPPFFTRLNLYTAAVGATGSGKDDPPSKVNQMLYAAGLLDTSTEGVASGVALQRALSEASNKMLFYWQDEIWEMIQSSKQQGAPYKRELAAVLMTLYGRAGKVFGGRKYANKKDNISQIERPYVVFGGATTEVRFMEALSDKHVADGFLNRLIVFQSDGMPDLVPPKLNAIPEPLKTKLRGLANTNALVGVDLENLEKIRPEESINLEREVGVDDFLHGFGQEAKNVGGPFGALWSRGFENAVKVAGILAVGCDPEEPIITMKQAHWAVNLVKQCLEGFSIQLDRNLADNEFHALCNKAMELIRYPRRYGNDGRWGYLTTKGLPRGILLRNLHVKAFQMDEVVKYLEESGQIEAVGVDKTTLYRVRN